MWIAFIVCISIVSIVIVSVGLEPLLSYKKKKLEEEHSTANLALACQILSTRPELSLEQVQCLIETSKNKTKLLEQE